MRDVVLGASSFGIEPKSLTTEQKKAFLLAATDASMAKYRDVDPAKITDLLGLQMQYMANYEKELRAAASNITRHDVGGRVGFASTRSEKEKTVWDAYFSEDPWMLHVFCSYPAAVHTEFETALAVLGSLRICAPYPCAPADGSAFGAAFPQTLRVFGAAANRCGLPLFGGTVRDTPLACELGNKDRAP